MNTLPKVIQTFQPMETQPPFEPLEPTTPTSQAENNEPAPKDAFFQDIAHDIQPSQDTIINEQGEEEINLPPTPEETFFEERTDKEASSSASDFIELREMVQAAGIAFIADGSITNADKYLYDEAQRKKLIQAWSPIIQKSGIKISPWFKVLAAEATCTGPIVALAFENRKYRKEADRMRREIEELKAQQGNISFSKNEVGAPSIRRDNKNAWRIDANGFFEFDAEGVQRIKIADRKKKPKLPSDYEQLIKHNGKDFVHQVLKIENE